MRAFSISTLLVSAIAAFAAPSAEAASPKRVLQACINAASPKISGNYVVSAGIDGSGQYARIEAGSSVSPQMAHAINQCANANGGNTGNAKVSKTTAGSVANDAWQWANEVAGLTATDRRGRPISAWARDQAAREARALDFARDRRCEPESPILYRGNLYCLKD